MSRLWLPEKIPGAGEGRGKREMQRISEWGWGVEGGHLQILVWSSDFSSHLHRAKSLDGNICLHHFLMCKVETGESSLVFLLGSLTSSFNPHYIIGSVLRPGCYLPGSPRHPKPLEAPVEEGRLAESLSLGRPFSRHMQVCRIYIDGTQLQVINKVDLNTKKSRGKRLLVLVLCLDKICLMSAMFIDFLLWS